MIDFNFALITLYPNIVFTEDKKGFDKDGNEVVYDTVAVEALVSSLSYINKRQSEYPSIQEQMDMQYWDAINGTTTWQDAINAVKTKYPKGA
jgi:beta-galactosidase GanA